MEVLNAASLTPVSVLSDRRAEPKKNLSLPSISLPNFSKPTALNSSSSSSKFSEVLSRSFNGGLVALSSIFSGGFAKALTYEEALELSNTTATSVGNDSDFVDNAIKIVTENPAIVIGGFAILGLPLVLSQFFNKKPKSFGVESAKNAYSKLGEDGNAQLLDIRGLKDIREVGSPDLRGLKKKTVSIAYKGEDKPGFLKKLALKFKDPENTTLFILDKFDGSSELVAELVTVNGFKAAYAIKDGAEGPRGWTNSGLPWIEPKKTFSFDFSGLTDTLGETSGALSVTLGLAAATGLGLLAFTEVETILQLLGSAALVQLVSKKLLFAEDRKQTLQLVDEFLTTKVAPKELVGEIKEIGLALLPSTVNKKALPAPTKETPDTGAAADNVLKSEKTPELTPEPAVEAAAEPPALVNTTPLAEVKEESFPTLSRPLSPYAQYPDFKPPTSPCPSQP